MRRPPLTSSPVPAEDVIPLGGRIREAPEDFRVEEIPLYEPTGEGEHLMVLVEKVGLTSPMMISRLGQRLGVRPRDVGWAGYKDRHAVTRQWLTIPARPLEDVLSVQLPGIRVLEAHLHKNKLRTGHLRGNRFILTIRGVDPESIPAARALFYRVAARGMPNGIGPQRFGVRGDNYFLGRALLDGDAEKFLELASTPLPELENPRVVEARTALGEGRLADALAAFPRDFLLERHLCIALQKSKGDATYAVKTLPSRARSLLVTAWQSLCFNAVLTRRIDSYDRFIAGDIAMKHANGACFQIEDVETETPRLEAHEISPTGPLPGLKMMQPTEASGVLEGEVLAECGARDEAPSPFVGRKGFQGARRSLRALITEPSFMVPEEAPENDVVVLTFGLPKGSFATSLLAFFGF